MAVRKKFLRVTVVKRWGRLPREVPEALKQVRQTLTWGGSDREQGLD